MNGQRAMVVVLLIAALFVLGSLSASLEGTVSSTPDDAIDVDTNSLPFAGDGASEIADSYRSAEDGTTGQVADSAEGGPAEAADADSAGDSEGGPGGEDGPNAGSDGPNGDREGGSGGQGQEGGGSGESGQSGGSGEGDSGAGPGDGYAESLWDTIAQYVVLALALLALLALVAIGRVLARRREQLRARLRALAERYGLLGDSAGDDVAVPDGEGEAATVVERAWAEMLHDSGASPSPGDTPRECADAAIAAGGDPAAVEELTEMYERVRYGDGSVTTADASQALEHARAIGPDDGRHSIDPGPTSGTASGGEGSHP